MGAGRKEKSSQKLAHTVTQTDSTRYAHGKSAIFVPTHVIFFVLYNTKEKHSAMKSRGRTLDNNDSFGKNNRPKSPSLKIIECRYHSVSDVDDSLAI